MEVRDREAARDLAVLHGHQLEREVRMAMPAAGIKSVAELARQSRVQRDTLYAWFRGDQPPKPATLQKVADTLGVRLGDLWDYQPVDATPSSLSPAQAAEIRAVVAEAVASAVDARLERIERLLGDLGGGPAPGPRKPPPRR